MNDSGRMIRFEDMVEGNVVEVDLFSGKVALLPNFSLSGGAEAASGTLGTAGTEIYFSDDSYVGEYLSAIRNKSGHLGFILLSTLGCNLNCTYCYEKELVDKRAVLHENTIDKVRNYLLYQVEQYKPRKVTIVYSGGEPLLNKKAVLQSSGVLHETFADQGIEFHFSIVTNGTVRLSEADFAKLKRNGLELLQVSLDGPRNIHNSRRLASFDVYSRVIQFIRDGAAQEVPVVIRVNIDRENVGGLEQLFKEIGELDKQKVAISYYLTEEPVCERQKCETGSSFEYDHETMKSATRQAEQYGFSVLRNNSLKSHCMCNVPFNTVIDPTGKLYKCGGMIGVEKEYLGDIERPEAADMEAKRYIENRIKEECRHCKLLPMCMGGCNYTRYGEEECSEAYKSYILGKVRSRLTQILEDKHLLTV